MPAQRDHSPEEIEQKRQAQPEYVPFLTRQELEKLERQLIPLLNTIRRLLGKGPLS